MRVIELQVVEIYPYKSFREKMKLFKELQKIKGCKLEVFEGFFFIEKFDLVPAEFDFKRHRRIRKRRRRGRGKKKIRRDSRAS